MAKKEIEESEVDLPPGMRIDSVTTFKKVKTNKGLKLEFECMWGVLRKKGRRWVRERSGTRVLLFRKRADAVTWVFDNA